MSEEITRRRFIALGTALAGATVLGGAGYAATWAPEPELPHTRMGDGMSKVLVVYGTSTGCTAGIAERIGATLAETGASVEVVSASVAPDPAGYDAVLVGSGVRAGSWHKAPKQWVAANADALKAGRVAFYTACLGMADAPQGTDEFRAYTDALIAETGVEPVDVGLFAGWNEPKTFSFVERTILKMMKAPEGDFRDWDAIDAWTRDVAQQLAV